MIKLNMIMIVAAFFLVISCSENEIEEVMEEVVEDEMTNDSSDETEEEILPQRPGDRPATTDGIPHVQLDLDKVDDVHEEMIRRIFSVPGIMNEPSVILSWEGLWIDPEIELVHPQAVISGRELGHVHDDGSLHIFLEPSRAIEAIEAGWAVSHPYAAQGSDGWEGFVMLYTPTTMEELNIVFQLIVEAYNYVTGEEIEATDFY